MLRFLKQYPTKQQLYGLLPAISQNILDEQDMRGTAGNVRMNSLMIFSDGLLRMDILLLAG